MHAARLRSGLLHVEQRRDRRAVGDGARRRVLVERDGVVGRGAVHHRAGDEHDARHVGRCRSGHDRAGAVDQLLQRGLDVGTAAGRDVARHVGDDGVHDGRAPGQRVDELRASGRRAAPPPGTGHVHALVVDGDHRGHVGALHQPPDQCQADAVRGAGDRDDLGGRSGSVLLARARRRAAGAAFSATAVDLGSRRRLRRGGVLRVLRPERTGADRGVALRAARLPWSVAVSAASSPPARAWLIRNVPSPDGPHPARGAQ